MSIFDSLFGVPGQAAQPAGSTPVDKARRSYTSMNAGLEQNLREVRGGCVDGYVGNNGLDIYRTAQRQGANSYELNRLAENLMNRK